MKTLNDFIYEKLKLNKQTKLFNFKKNELVEQIMYTFYVESCENNKEYKKWISDWIDKNKIEDIVFILDEDDYRYLMQEIKQYDEIDSDDPEEHGLGTIIKDGQLIKRQLRPKVTKSEEVNIDKYANDLETPEMIVHETYQSITIYCLDKKVWDRL